MKEKKEAAQKNRVLESFKHDQKPIRLRFFATLIDFAVIMLICQLTIYLFGKPDWLGYLQTQESVRGLLRDDPQVLERMALYQECFITTLLIGMSYESLMMIFFKAPIGKLIFGLRVVDAKEGRHFLLSKLFLILRAAIKALSLYLVSAIPYLFMCLTTFGNPERRSGFDMFSGKKVISVRINNVRSEEDEDFGENRTDG